MGSDISPDVQESAEEISDYQQQDSNVSVTSKEKTSLTSYSLKECTKGDWILPPSLQISHDSTGNRGVEKWIASLPESPVNLIPLQENEAVKKIQGICGQTWQESLARWNQALSLSKMSKDSIVEMMRTAMKSRSTSTNWVILSSSGISALPRKGLRMKECVRSRSALSVPTLTKSDTWTGNLKSTQQKEGSRHSMGLIEVLTLPTMGKNEYKGSGKKRYRNSKDFRGAKMSEGLRTCSSAPIYLNHSFGEIVMGFPRGWTDISGNNKSLVWGMR